MTTAKIGQIVHYHTGGATGQGEYYCAAIVTMTPQEWQPGYRDAEGDWMPTTGVVSPKPGTVHLHMFLPPGTSAAAKVDLTDVPYGTNDQCWSEIS